jgi:hypothetical protein
VQSYRSVRSLHMQSLHLDILNGRWAACAFHKAKQFLIVVNLVTNVTAVNIVTTILTVIVINMLYMITMVTAFGKLH